MRSIYTRQGNYFRKAYENGTHGWPAERSTPQVATLIERLGRGAGQTALDVGCGEGRHTILLAKRGYAVVGLDPEPLAVRKATEFVTSAGASAQLVIGNVLNLSFPSGAFDLVLDYGCFHHLVTRDWPRYRQEIARVLKPGGHFVLSVFSTKFKHHSAERRSRNWIVHQNHYDHFFTLPEITAAFLDSFELKAEIEEHERLSGYFHVLMQSNSRSSRTTAGTRISTNRNTLSQQAPDARSSCRGTPAYRTRTNSRASVPYAERDPEAGSPASAPIELHDERRNSP